jgi:hypothetical protein
MVGLIVPLAQRIESGRTLKIPLFLFITALFSLAFSTINWSASVLIEAKLHSRLQSAQVALNRGLGVA